MRFLSSILTCLLLCSGYFAIAAGLYGPPTALNGSCAGVGGVAVDSRSGTVFAACSATDSIVAWPGGNGSAVPVTLSGACDYGEGMWWNAARSSLFVVCNGYNHGVPSVKRYDSLTSPPITLPGVPTRCGLHFIAVDVDNTVYASCDSGGVLKWQDTTRAPIVLSDAGACLYSRQIAINPITGDVFQACMGTNTLLQWVNGVGIPVKFLQCNRPEGLAIASNGDLYVACAQDNTIFRFTFDAVSQKYSTKKQAINGRCNDNGGVQLEWASTGLFATCDSEPLLKHWSVEALRVNGGPEELGAATSVAVSTYGGRVYAADWATNQVQQWQLAQG